MTSHYAPEVSVNVLSPRQVRPVTRARKRPLSSIHFTYADLKKLFSSHLAHDLGIASSSFPNMVSALNAFMAECRFTDLTVIGSTLRASFYKTRDKHLEGLRAQGRPTAFVSNRKSLLGKWRAALVEADRRNSAARSEESPFQAALKALLAEKGSIKGTARNAYVPLATLRRWLSGAIPNGRSIVMVPRIERLYALPSRPCNSPTPRMNTCFSA